MWLKVSFFLLVVFYISNITPVIGVNKCVPKTFRGPDNPMVCVCNATYCDEFPPLGQLSNGQAAVYTSSQSGKRFERTDTTFNSNGADAPIQFTLDDSKTYQKIIGFGGAFTDAAALNAKRLSPQAMQNLVNAFYGKEGIGLNTGRVPIACSDFSTRVYTYDDVSGDVSLANFKLQDEDFSYKIPLIKLARAQAEAQGINFKLFAAPWRSPTWLAHGANNTDGSMNATYYQTWANYFVRFFEEYNKENVTFWGLSLQNEPDVHIYPMMTPTPATERDFVKFYLGPAIRQNPLTNGLKIMIHDTNRHALDDYANTVFSDPIANSYVDGVAIHWYSEWLDAVSRVGNVSALIRTHQNYPDKFMLYTEACTGFGTDFPVGTSLGDWSRADRYAHDQIEDLNNWVTGWTDWNLCLNETGGYTNVHTHADAPIIVNNTIDEFYKQPMYYARGHVSKFLVENSVKVQLDVQGVNSTTYVEATAFATPTNQRVVVLNNRDVVNSYNVQIKDVKFPNKRITIALESRSFVTIVYNSA